MGLKEIVKRLEQRASVEKELCPHLPPIIEHADGSMENASTHDCGMPRLRIAVGHTDNSDVRTREAARDTYAQILRECDLPPLETAEIVAAQFHVTTAELLERAA